MTKARAPATFGVIGCGTIGGNVARQAIDRGYRVVTHDIGGVPADILASGAAEAVNLDQLASEVKRPRIVFLFIPAGPAVDDVLEGLAAVFDPGDIVIDGGNSYWGDSRRRHERLAADGLAFVDLGTSGGAAGARRGACFMAGCEPDVFASIAPILTDLAVKGGVIHAGPPGAGHFVKLVHNGIEFGMLQAIAEGVGLLNRFYDNDADTVGAVLEGWRHGSVIRSWLLDLMAEGFNREHGLEKVSAHVEDTGEVNWLVSDAMNMEVPVPITAQAVMTLLQSRAGDRDYEKAIALMRHGFGDHPIGPEPAIARHRHQSRVGPPMGPEPW